MFPMRDVESCEGLEPRAIAFERHESGILREKSFDSIGETMEPVKVGAKFAYSYAGDYKQIVDPATNTNGVVISTVVLTNGKIFTGPVKPAWVGEASFPVVMIAGVAPTLNPFPILLPPGHGLWVSGGNSGEARITYDVLP